jgi:hypothetical protein
VEASTRAGGTHAVARRGGRRVAAIATLAVGALAVAAGIAVVLSHAEVRRTNTNDVVARGLVGTLSAGHRVCQDGERVPAGTAAIGLAAQSSGQAAGVLAVELLDLTTQARVAGGTAAAGRGATTTVPLRPSVRRERAVRVCLRLRAPATAAAVALYGGPADTAASAMDGSQALGGRVRIDYLGGTAESWWSLAPTVARRIGYGHAWSTSAVALLAALLTLTSIGLAAWLLLRPS